ncbi:hypothetical protein NDU88_003417 [Pleurodeles waltl]|uniref:Uncharacterized protein n=1 Tax=Pleurodeles waltl TaxID=8319 RepID=A0AAV7NGL7_PLEWA|nr:hypothetical protein NDU88_003417 [Pleurodeles waltl]
MAPVGVKPDILSGKPPKLPALRGTLSGRAQPLRSALRLFLLPWAARLSGRRTPSGPQQAPQDSGAARAPPKVAGAAYPAARSARLQAQRGGRQRRISPRCPGARASLSFLHHAIGSRGPGPGTSSISSATSGRVPRPPNNRWVGSGPARASGPLQNPFVGAIGFDTESHAIDYIFIAIILSSLKHTLEYLYMIDPYTCTVNVCALCNNVLPLDHDVERA